jgi:hypothetical protein
MTFPIILVFFLLPSHLHLHASHGVLDPPGGAQGISRPHEDHQQGILRDPILIESSPTHLGRRTESFPSSFRTHCLSCFFLLSSLHLSFFPILTAVEVRRQLLMFGGGFPVLFDVKYGSCTGARKTSFYLSLIRPFLLTSLLIFERSLLYSRRTKALASRSRKRQVRLVRSIEMNGWMATGGLHALRI